MKKIFILFLVAALLMPTLTFGQTIDPEGDFTAKYHREYLHKFEVITEQLLVYHSHGTGN